MSGGKGYIHTAVIRGVEAIPVDVEVDISGGIPGISIIGMPDSAVLEARMRVRCALKSTGFEIPRLLFTFNLAPGDVKKTGTGFDLPLAIGLLSQTGQIPINDIEKYLFVGELGLQGEICGVRGGVAYGLLAKKLGLKLVCSVEMAEVAELLDNVVFMESIAEAKDGMHTIDTPEVQGKYTNNLQKKECEVLDYIDVADQEVAKRAMVIAATGRHGILMIGPPGAGKTMLARRLPTILPELSQNERLESAVIHSVAGLSTDRIICGEPPFRSPHHSASLAGLMGGGRPVKPGEVSLANKGVLFLDELPEFANNVLQSLRQPLEDKCVRVVRADGAYVFPADFLLVAAANPCPCGHLGDPGHHCSCSAASVERYQNKIGGPLMDRIDIVCDVQRPKVKRVVEGSSGLSSKEMREMVREGREFRKWREKNVSSNEGSGAIKGLAFSEEAQDRLTHTAQNLSLGGRAVVRIARVARTIADLSKREKVSIQDVSEASLFRPHDSKMNN